MKHPGYTEGQAVAWVNRKLKQQPQKQTKSKHENLPGTEEKTEGKRMNFCLHLQVSGYYRALIKSRTPSII